VPSGELERMRADAAPMAGAAWLRRVALSDELLVLAQRFARRPEPVAVERREVLHHALVADPSAWVVAAGRAVAWRAEAAVSLARDAYDGARAPTDADRRRLTAEAGQRHDLRTGVVALSGLDGSGKSTQAHALAATLAKLGHDTSLEWTRLSFDAWLDVVAAPVKAALGWRRRGSSGPVGGSAEVAADAPQRLRARSPVVHQTWTAVVATANGSTQRRTTLAQLRAGRVVVRDRYVLDSVVQLHSVYGADRDVSAQARIIERMSPRPLAAYYLQLPADEAYRRKPEEYTVADLTGHAELYEREADRLGVVRVDALRSRADVAAELAGAVWRLVT
jgi:thymidylate kinase